MSNPVAERRFGRIDIDMASLLDSGFSDAISRSSIVVLESICDPCTDQLRYKAAWRKFDPVPVGDVVPRYGLVFNSDTMELSCRKL